MCMGLFFQPGRDWDWGPKKIFNRDWLETGPGVQKFSGQDWDWGLKKFPQRLVRDWTWSPKYFWLRLGLWDSENVWPTKGCVNRGQIKNQFTQD